MIELTDRQARGLERLGTIMAPGNDALPAFSDTGAAGHLPVMLAHMTERDRNDVLGLLGFAAGAPKALLRGMLRMAESGKGLPGATGAAMRTLVVGVKGITLAPYYSDFTSDGAISRAVGYDAVTVTPEEKLGTQARSVESRKRAERQKPSRRRPVSRDASKKRVEQAFAAARAVAPSIREMPMDDRVERIRALRQMVVQERDWIIDEICLATGKTPGDALVSEVFGVLDHLVWLEKNAKAALKGEKVSTPIALMGKKSSIRFEPMGPILVIAPWNYPFYQAIVPITSAFVAGNPVVFKPSEYTPMEGLVEALLERSGWDAGWVQVVYGRGATGAALIDQQPAKVFFTGSQRTGSAIMQQAAGHLVPVELELGGKDAMIVFDDASVRRVASGAAWGGLTNAGQSCTSVELLYVQEGAYEAVRDALVEEVDRIRLGHQGRDGDVGSMTTPFQLETVRRHLDDALAKGARVANAARWDGQSNPIPPLVLEDVSPDMLVVSEETFGPIIAILSFADEADVVARANATPFGLSASVWTKDLQRARRVAAALDVGNVSINNVMITEGNPNLPFGGAKKSGFGRYKGVLGLRAFTNIKSVMEEKDRGAVEANWYPYDEEKIAIFDRLTVHLFGRRRPRLVRFAAAGLKLESYAQKARREPRGAAPDAGELTEADPIGSVAAERDGTAATAGKAGKAGKAGTPARAVARQR